MKNTTILICCLFFIVGCGGSSDSPTPTPTPTPTPLDDLPIVPTIKATEGDYTDRIVIEWDSQSNTNIIYRLHRSNVAGSLGNLIADQSESGYTDTAVEIDKFYYYQVNACLGSNCGESSAEVAGYAAVHFVDGVPVSNDLTPTREDESGGLSCIESEPCVSGLAKVTNLWPLGHALTIAFDFTEANRNDSILGFCESKRVDEECRDSIRAFIIATAREWTNFGNIRMVESRNWPTADITIAFDDRLGDWSHLGVESRNVRPSMNLSNINSGTILHEFGHALGFEHEQHSPSNLFVFDEAAVIRSFEGIWDEERVRHNVLSQLGASTRGLFVSDQYDPRSIMHYSIPRDWVVDDQSCPSTLASMCIESNEVLSDIDQSSMNILYPENVSTTTPWTVTHEISSGNGGSWGKWHGRVLCPENQYAYGFLLRTEADQGGGDDSAANSLRLYCRPEGSRLSGGVITSHPGFYGEWGSPKLCTGTDQVTGFQLKVEEPQGNNDDSAANNINMMCSGGYAIEGDGGIWGKWSEWKYCEANEAVCGMRLKIEDDLGPATHDSAKDDSALNDVLLYCCTK